MVVTSYYCKRNFKTAKQIYCLTMVLVNDKVVACGSDNDINIYNLPKKALIKQLRGHTRTVTSLCVETTRDLVVSGSEDWTIKVWNWQKNNALLRTLRGHTRSVVRIIVLSERWLVSASMDHSVRVWSIGSGCCEGEKYTETAVVDMLQKDDGTLIMCGEDNKIYVWSVETANKTEFIEAVGSDSLFAL